MWPVRMEFTIPDRAGRIEHPLEDLGELSCRRLGPGGSEVSLGVVHRAGQHVQLVVQFILVEL